MADEEDEAVIPNDILREIEIKVAFYMHRQFPAKEYVPKVPKSGSKSRDKKASQAAIESHTWSSINLRKQNEKKDPHRISTLDIIEEDSKPDYKHMDTIEKERIRLDWVMKKDYEKRLRETLVAQAMAMLAQEKQREQAFLEQKRQMNQ